MIAALRARHRWVWLALALALPLLVFFALRARPGRPTTRDLPPGVTSTADDTHPGSNP